MQVKFQDLALIAARKHLDLNNLKVETILRNILIIGAGNMGGALAKGLCSSGSSYSVCVHDTHSDLLTNLHSRLGVVAIPDLDKTPLEFDVIILCVKPQDLDGVSQSIVGRIKAETVVVSILAGVTIDSVRESLKFNGAIVRSMPNICATVGEAATALCHNDCITTEQQSGVLEIFNTIGVADWTKESLLDAVTGLSGSGPAYLYMIIEALADGGVKMGIPHNLASKLAVQTVLGSAKLVQETNEHPAVLRDQVTTPGGTTIHAIQELEERGLRAMIMRAVQTATERSAHLRKK